MQRKIISRVRLALAQRQVLAAHRDATVTPAEFERRLVARARLLAA
jgi:hypothetical protein